MRTDSTNTRTVNAESHQNKFLFLITPIIIRSHTLKNAKNKCLTECFDSISVLSKLNTQDPGFSFLLRAITTSIETCCIWQSID